MHPLNQGPVTINIKGSDHFWNIRYSLSIILQRILQELGTRMWTGLIQQRIETSGRFYYAE
jgi:hypothetical protein